MVSLLLKIIDESKSGASRRTTDREKLWKKFLFSRNAKDFENT